MTYSITDEIQVTLSCDEYREQLDNTIREIAGELNDRFDNTEIDDEKVEIYVVECLGDINDIYLTRPISVIEHATATLSHRGASRLGDVTSTEDFAHEHARDLFEQDVISAFEEILDGETVAGISMDESTETDAAFA